MPRADFSNVALTLAGNDFNQKLTAEFLDLVKEDNWVARLVASLVSLSANEGHQAFAANPDLVLRQVEEAIKQWRIDMSYGLKLARLYPQHFAEPEKWHAQHSEDGSAAA
jgi:hypothetical protein